MKRGYVRVSDPRQSGDGQAHVLEGHHIDRLYRETASSVKRRPELERLMRELEPGDLVVTFALDRLGRSTIGILKTIEAIHELGARVLFTSQPMLSTADEGADPFTVAMRAAMRAIFAAFAQLEREQNRARTRAALEARRARGAPSGRKPKLTSEQQRAAVRMLDEGRGLSEVARIFDVDPSTIWRYRQRSKQENQP